MFFFSTKTFSAEKKSKNGPLLRSFVRLFFVLFLFFFFCSFSTAFHTVPSFEFVKLFCSAPSVRTLVTSARPHQQKKTPKTKANRTTKKREQTKARCFVRRLPQWPILVPFISLFFWFIFSNFFFKFWSEHFAIEGISIFFCYFSFGILWPKRRQPRGYFCDRILFFSQEIAKFRTKKKFPIQSTPKRPLPLPNNQKKIETKL